MNSKKVEETIFREVSKCIEEIKTLPFDEGLSIFQRSVWEIGEKYRMKGDDVVKIYFDNYNNKQV